MKPLKKIKVPVNQIAMMISIALRFIPTIMDEVNTIVKAQQARGWISPPGVSTPGSSAWCQSWCPCLSGAFRRAEDLAVAMEARGYDPDQERTRYRQLTWRRPDSIALAVVVIVSVLFFVARILL